jgi:DNA sulfur modification protein DndD
MQIRRLVMHNFGLFRGRTEIELTPRQRYNKRRPVVLLGGTNGAGKTTILDAIRLCLYGPLALGERISQDEYHAYLRNSIYRNDHALIQLHSAAVELEFELGLAGRLHVFNVQRSWERSGSSVGTSLTVTRDGASLDELERAHADDFLRDLVPLGVSQLFFFDGEKIQQMAQASDDDAALAHAIKSLLGLDLVKRLHSDLSVYSSRLRGVDSPKALKKELQVVDQRLQELHDERLGLVLAADQAQSRVDGIKTEIQLVDQRLSREGGGFAQERDKLKAEYTLIRRRVTELEQRARDLCSDLLPFAFATQLSRRLQHQLETEKKVSDWRIHQQLLQKRIAQVKATLKTKLFPSSAKDKLTATAKQQITKRVQKLLDALAQPLSDIPDGPLAHGLSDHTRKRLLNAIQRILSDLPRQVRDLELELETLTRRQLQITSSLDQIPDDDVLEPHLKQLNELNRKLGAAEAAAKSTADALRSHDHKVELQKRLKERKEQDVRAAIKGFERHEMVERVQSVLDDYSTALTKSRISQLSTVVADCFGQLWRKGDLLHRITIDPDTCSVILLDRQERVIPKERLSAGEKQIYAISMLWALARVSGRVLPMVIDTPLARLDSKHRSHLVTRYFPHVSHQVIILSTDTEIDQEYFNELGPSVSHAYHLEYDDADARTIVEDGYFWSRRDSEALT